MTLAEEYCLSEYEQLGLLRGTEDIYIVRNIIDGTICLKKKVPIELKGIYNFLKFQENPYVPHIYECIESEGTLVVIEEYLPGKNLEEVLKERCFTEQEAVEVGIQLCKALMPLHSAKSPIICRDLKAENIMVNKNNHIKIVDFDISRVYQEGQNRDTKMMGTEGYAAPEQFGFCQTDARTDIYAIGVLLNYMVIHKFPVVEIAAGNLGVIIRRCTEMNPKDRFQNVSELEKALIQYQGRKKNVVSEVEIERKKSKKSFLPPGFRSGKLWKMLLAVVGYMFLAAISFEMEMSTAERALPLGVERLEQVIIFCTMLIFIAILFDYQGVCQSLPLLNRGKCWQKIVGYILAALILFVASAFVCATLEMLLL